MRCKRRIGKFKSLNWITQGIRISSKHKRELHKLQKISTNVDTIKFCIAYKKIFKKVVNKAKRMANDKFIKEAGSKSKAIWTVVRNELGQNSGLGSSEIDKIVINREEIVNPIKMAEYFNQYFINVTEDLGVCASDTKARLGLLNYKKEINSMIVVQLMKERLKI